ncbi:hypothetical protein TW85_14965 [Marinomonas sp. S3726]|uniref:hypothetical protein n=1 Tax=Marinomonas sp. S3726 TaxID=579484 RepID=UPI0005FA59EA|nr:hypothetical protein [Marinomonas sp. S3726]KJZ12421.1 hypothetical protein TW85_14965 [Marinomonas sp. S3726]
MARKANISREEIILACWSLLEQNYFPNIPRLTEYFLKKDGRKCSNTTFLKAITDWEELYKEQQEASFKDLSSVFMPSFKKFERDISRDLESLLEERLHQEKNEQSLKKDATHGQYLSLSELARNQAEDIEKQQDEIQQLQVQSVSDRKKIEYFEQRYQETLTTLKVAQTQSEHDKSQIKEATLNLSQKELDHSKLELKVNLLEEERGNLKAQLEVQAKQLNRQALKIEELISKTHENNVNELTSQLKELIQLQQKVEQRKPK